MTDEVPVGLYGLPGGLAVAAVLVATPLELTVLGALAAVVGVGFLSRAAPIEAMLTSAWPRRLVPAGSGTTLALLVLQMPADPEDFPQRYLTVGGSVSRGAYVETCGGAHRFTTVLPEPDQRRSVRLQGFVGQDEDTFIHGTEGTTSIWGGALVGSAQNSWMSATLGVVAGSFTIDGDVRSATPVLGLALGPPSIFAEARYADYDPAGVPGPLFQLGIGARVAGTGSLVRGGISDNGVYGSALFVTPGGWEIEPRVSYGDAETYQGGIGIRKRISVGRP